MISVESLNTLPTTASRSLMLYDDTGIVTVMQDIPDFFRICLKRAFYSQQSGIELFL